MGNSSVRSADRPMPAATAVVAHHPQPEQQLADGPTGQALKQHGVHDEPRRPAEVEGEGDTADVVVGKDVRRVTEG